MTANRAIGVPVTGTSPSYVGTTTVEARLALAGLYAENAPGVPRSGVLAQSATNLVTARSDGFSYDIAPCQLVIGRAANEGVYNPTLTGTTNAVSAAAPGSGSRWDLVYVLQRDPGKGDTDNQPVVGVVQGASGSTPTKPYGSVPAGAYVLAEAQIFSGTTYASQSPNTIAQVWRHTAARGAPVPVRNQAERDEITSPSIGMSAKRLDRKGTLELWDGAKWVGGGGASCTLTTVGVSPVQSFADGASVAVQFGTAVTDTDSMSNLGAQPTRVTITVSGRYSVAGGAGFSTNAATGRVVAWLRKNGTDIGYGGQAVPITNNGALSQYSAKAAVPNLDLVAGDYLELMVSQSSGFPQNINATAWDTGHLCVVQVG
ncbi:hypothetical protein SPF06_07010 [Sinomonas sp. JGH33]|uniref:Minor tail protein n=1 Tax=Sinomonas terricola TaxID=3110330 RepID=A0ABU5T4Q4_9MICC|nr:hypothetical protein [Sinomonas sp. JGH33]MEA5454466.1 hypothetical protein [Sinomonas sp. JGH33]